MDQFLHQPGFLGTDANMAADITLVIMVLGATLFTLGFYLARRHKYVAHRWLQTGTAALYLIMILWMMILPFRDFLVDEKSALNLNTFFFVTIVHASMGSIAVIFGTFVTLRANQLVPARLQFNNYKLFMRSAYALYMTAFLLGVMVYITWFVNI